MLSELWSAQRVWGPGRAQGSPRGQRQVFVPGLGAVSTDTQYFGPGTRLTVLGKQGRRGDQEGQRGRCGTPGAAAPVFVLCAGAVSQNTQYFGPGTRLTVLGKRPGTRGMHAGFCVGLGGCDGETQYFGRGTRLLVLGERRGPGFGGERGGCALQAQP